MRVLYVEHGKQVSGAQRSLLELLIGADWEIAVACPDAGPLADLLDAHGVPVVPLPGTEGSFKLHALHTPRMLVEVIGAALRLRRLARGYDVVHANSVRAGLMCFAVGRSRRRVVHVRDSLPRSLPGRLVRRAIEWIADDLIAISAYIAEDFGGDRPTVVHNAVDLERFSPEGPAADFGGGPFVGVFGQITPWKGQDDAIRAVGDRAKLLVVGEAKFVAAATRFDNRTFERSLHALAGPTVEFLGERDDVPELMRACDLVLVPSWQEPFGRVVVEAMACGTPVVASDRGGPAEVITDGVDGRLLPPRSPEVWRAAIGALLADDRARAEMGRAAAVSARRYSREEHVRRIKAIYDATP